MLSVSTYLLTVTSFVNIIKNKANTEKESYLLFIKEDYPTFKNLIMCMSEP